MLFSDIHLARRLERAEGLANAAFVDARASMFPESGACWTEISGTRCMFDSVDSPVTQTFGLGMFEPVEGEALSGMEAFFQVRGSAVFHEVSPLADVSTLGILNERGYKPLEFTTVLVRELGPEFGQPETPCAVRLALPEESEHWAALSMQGWNMPELSGFFETMLAANAARRDFTSFYAEVDGRAVATASLCIAEGVALLAGASTVPEARGRGAQQSLLAHRLHYAAQRGCTVAMMGTQPGSASQRNAQRNGFDVAYTRLKWRLG